MNNKIFITGTGTDVGKTFVTALLIKKMKELGLQVGYYKAAMSGNDRDENGRLIPGDATWVKKISGIAQEVESMCPYVYERAYSPHLASRYEGNPVELSVVEKGFKSVEKDYDYVVMEGSGGIMCPIAFDNGELYLEDVVKALDMPCIIVANAGLGTINNVVLTVEYMRNRGITIKGILFNHYHKGDPIEEDNIRMCEHLTGLKVLACVADNDADIKLEVDMVKEIFA